MLILIWSVVATAVLIFYLREKYSKLSKQGINHLPVVPFFGNSARMALIQEHQYKIMERVYYAFPDDRVSGCYEFLTPYLIVRDVELLKKITVKDCEYFIDRREVLNGVEDPFLSRSMFMMKGEEWKDMRSSLSPAFTSSKIRLMVPFMVEVGQHMTALLKQRIQDTGVGHIDVEFKDLSSRYANDVIATCAFGIKVDSQSDSDQFYSMTKELINLSPTKIFKFLTMKNIPLLKHSLDLAIISRTAYAFFRDVVLNAMSLREERNIVRNDMIHLLMEAKKGRLAHDSKDKEDDNAGFSTVEESEIGKMQRNREWTDTDLVSQAILFLFAGYDTVSTTMSFLAHQLATHPEVQERLVQEIIENERNGEKFEYSTVQNLKYLDMVVSEVLRMYPPAPAIDRACLKDYNIGRPNKTSTKDHIMRKGDAIFIPVWSFHHDERFFPEPYKFDPERFSDKSKHNIKPFTYMPFGLGPRNCIGSRFALCEVKVMAYHLLKHFQLSPCERTCQPVQLENDRVNLKIKGGFWLRMEIRDEHYIFGDL